MRWASSLNSTGEMHRFYASNSHDRAYYPAFCPQIRRGWTRIHFSNNQFMHQNDAADGRVSVMETPVKPRVVGIVSYMAHDL